MKAELKMVRKVTKNRAIARDIIAEIFEEWDYVENELHEKYAWDSIACESLCDAAGMGNEFVYIYDLPKKYRRGRDTFRSVVLRAAEKMNVYAYFK